MRYGLPASGGRWHPLTAEGSAICGAAVTLVLDGEEVDPELRCGNCDARLRDAGTRARKAAEAAERRREPAKDVYEPKHTSEPRRTRRGEGR